MIWDHKKMAKLPHKKGIPGLMEEKIEEEVKQRRVEQFLKAAENMADKRVKEIKQEKLPKWMEAEMQPKIKSLKHELKTSVKDLLTKRRTVTCGKCDTEAHFTPTPWQITTLLEGRHIMIKCPNQNSTNLLGGHHRISLKLEDFLKTELDYPKAVSQAQKELS